MDEAKNQINDLDKEAKNTTQNNKKKKEYRENEDSINNLWENFKRSNIHLTGVPEGKEKEQEIGNLKK